MISLALSFAISLSLLAAIAKHIIVFSVSLALSILPLVDDVLKLAEFVDVVQVAETIIIHRLLHHLPVQLLLLLVHLHSREVHFLHLVEHLHVFVVVGAGSHLVAREDLRRPLARFLLQHLDVVGLGQLMFGVVFFTLQLLRPPIILVHDRVVLLDLVFVVSGFLLLLGSAHAVFI